MADVTGCTGMFRTEREIEGKYATLSARLGMRGEGQEERGLDRTQVSSLCIVQLDEWRLFSRL